MGSSSVGRAIATFRSKTSVAVRCAGNAPSAAEPVEPLRGKAGRAAARRVHALCLGRWQLAARQTGAELPGRGCHLVATVSTLSADSLAVTSARLRYRLPDAHWLGPVLALTAALIASGWLAANSSPLVWLLWVPVPAIVAFLLFDSDRASRRKASLVIGIVVCFAGLVFVLWGWFLYIPAGLILLATSAMPAR